MTADLVQFLRACLDEDEQTARTAGGTWWAPPDLPGQVHDSGGVNIEAEFASFAAHIARHDPARVLAEVDAKRRLLDDVVPAINGLDDRIDLECGRPSGYPRVYQSEDLLRALALPYASHPDYRPECAPNPA